MTEFREHISGERLSDFGKAGHSPLFTAWEKRHLDDCSKCMRQVAQILSTAIEKNENEARKNVKRAKN